jgi:hypothetical protein
MRPDDSLNSKHRTINKPVNCYRVTPGIFEAVCFIYAPVCFIAKFFASTFREPKEKIAAGPFGSERHRFSLALLKKVGQ